MALMDIVGGSESRSFVDPNQAPLLKRSYQEAGRIYGENPARPEFMNEYQQLIPLIQSGLLSTLGGEYMPGGDAFNTQLEAIGRQIQPQIASQFAGSGRFGSGLHQTAMTQALADAGTRLYSDERARQLGLLREAPQIASNVQSGYYGTPYAGLEAFRRQLGTPTVLQEGRSSEGLGSLVGFNYNMG